MSRQVRCIASYVSSSANISSSASHSSATSRLICRIVCCYPVCYRLLIDSFSELFLHTRYGIRWALRYEMRTREVFCGSACAFRTIGPIVPCRMCRNNSPKLSTISSNTSHCPLAIRLLRHIVVETWSVASHHMLTSRRLRQILYHAHIFLYIRGSPKTVCTAGSRPRDAIFVCSPWT